MDQVPAILATLDEAREAYARGDITLDEFETLLHRAVVDKPAPRRSERALAGEATRGYLLYFALPVLAIVECAALAHDLISRNAHLLRVPIAAALIAIGCLLVVGMAFVGLYVGTFPTEQA